MPSRRDMLRATTVAALGHSLSPSTRAQSWPTRPIQLYVAFAAGGTGDLVARTVAREMGRVLGQAIVIENRPAPSVAPATTARAKPDGHTLMVAGNGTALSAALFRNLPFDLMKDFVHISTMAFFDLALITAPASPLQTVADLLAHARARPGRLTIGTVRLGSTQNLAAEMFKSMAAIDAVVVPFRTTGEILTALRAGDVQVAFELLPPILPQVQSRAVRVLALGSAQRFAGLPQVPTLAESGLPQFEATSWNGISAPAGTPPAVVERLQQAVQQALAHPEVQRELQQLGMTARASSPQEMSQRMRSDIARWAAVIERSHIERQ